MFELIFKEYLKKHRHYPTPTELKELCLKSLIKETLEPTTIFRDLLSFFNLFNADSESDSRLNHMNEKPTSSGTLAIFDIRAYKILRPITFDVANRSHRIYKP